MAGSDPSPEAESVRKEIAPIREEIRHIGDSVIDLKSINGVVQRITNTEARGEAIANVMLAYRHLEDARFRLSLIIQES